MQQLHTLHGIFRFYNTTNCDQLHIKICPEFTQFLRFNRNLMIHTKSWRFWSLEGQALYKFSQWMNENCSTMKKARNNNLYKIKYKDSKSEEEIITFNYCTLEWLIITIIKFLWIWIIILLNNFHPALIINLNIMHLTSFPQCLKTFLFDHGFIV